MEIIALFIIGLFIGSFLNVLAERLPKGKTVLWGRSHCDHCLQTLRWFELIPLFSFMVQHGRCRRCLTRLSWQYPLVEFSTGVMFALIGYGHTPILSTPVSLLSLGAALLLASSLLVIFISDFKYQIIPDSMVIAGITGLLLLHGALNFQFLTGQHFFSALGAAGFFFTLYLVTGGRGLGLGDVKLGALLGLWLGYPKTVTAIYVAFLTGAIAGVILILAKRKTMKSKVALGPFLIGGALVANLWGENIVQLWQQFL